MSKCDVCERDVKDGVACKDCGGAEGERANDMRLALSELLNWVDHQRRMGFLQSKHCCLIQACDCAPAKARQALEKYA